MADEIAARSLRGTMPVQYRYTPGAAGVRFFETLRAKGVLAATRCAADGITYLPPRLYCAECFADLSETWLELPARGYVHTWTVVHVDRQGRPLARPEIAAFVRIEGTDGGLVTRLLNVEPAAVRIGLEVEAVLRPMRERRGTLEDIVGFAPSGALPASLPAAPVPAATRAAHPARPGPKRRARGR
jgi:uncharacterized OB-fold protein